MKIRLLGVHNCESADTRLLSVLIDDCLVLDAGGLTSSLSLEAQRKVKAILLTHQHYDHIRDIPMIAMNCYLISKSFNYKNNTPRFHCQSGGRFVQWRE